MCLLIDYIYLANVRREGDPSAFDVPQAFFLSADNMLQMSHMMLKLKTNSLGASVVVSSSEGHILASNVNIYDT